MTQEQKDAAWRSLPEDFKRQLRCDYTTAESTYSLDPTNVRIETHKYFLDMYFGKHNLTASEEEEKPKFKVGDCVKVCISNNSVYRKGDVCLVMNVIKDNNGYHYELDRSRAMLISEEFLASYIEEQAPPLKASASESLSQMARDEMEDNAPILSTSSNIGKDWLAYRMELAKEVVNGLLFTGKSPETIVDETTTIVNGIVERLKGGEK